MFFPSLALQHQPACAALGRWACVVACAVALMSPPVHASPIQEAERLLQVGQADAALRHIDRALEAQPQVAQLQFQRALALTALRRPDEAMRVYTALTQDYPELPEPFNNLAVLQAARGDIDQARASLEAALRSHPSHATSLENLGEVYLMLAARSWSQSIAATPPGGQTDRLATRLAALRSLQAAVR